MIAIGILLIRKRVDWRTRCLRASAQMLKPQIDNRAPPEPSVISRETAEFSCRLLYLIIEGIRTIAFQICAVAL